jgi:hypothetical protein
MIYFFICIRAQNFAIELILNSSNLQLDKCEADQLCRMVDSSSTLANLDNPFEHSGELYTLLLQTGEGL